MSSSPSTAALENQISILQANISTLLAWQSTMTAQTSPAVMLSTGVPMNSGDTAWMLCATAIVLLMSLPGLALFYGGMSQAKNVLSTVGQTYSIACLITIQWFMMTYSLCFSTGSAVFGGAQRFWLIGTSDTKNQQSPERLGLTSAHALAPTIPESVYMTYQLTFAIITAALVCGSFAERMKFNSMLVFIFIWHFLVYCPVCHSEWGMDGFLALAGDLDFAGGNVVHISSGFSGLAASLILGPRKGFGVIELRPHNVVYSVIGGSLLWVGWFGFNAGSAVSAGTRAGFAMMVTQICAATCGVMWMLLEFAHKGKPSVIGIVAGSVCGLVIITPASGFVDYTAAFVMGVIGTPIVYGGVLLKKRLGYDDALDAFGVHGIGGVCGGVLTGFFANDFVTGSQTQKGIFYGRGVQIGYQMYGTFVIAAWSFCCSFVILMLVKAIMGLRVSEQQEVDGLDISEHGESMLEVIESQKEAISKSQHALDRVSSGSQSPVTSKVAPSPLVVVAND